MSKDLSFQDCSFLYFVNFLFFSCLLPSVGEAKVVLGGEEVGGVYAEDSITGHLLIFFCNLIL